MAVVTVRAQTRGDDEWVMEIRSRINDHLPPFDLDSYRHFQQMDDMVEQAHTERVVVECEGTRVAAAVLEKMWWASTPGRYWGAISVDPDMWGKGIGRETFEWLVSHARALGANRLYSSVRKDRPQAQTFVEHRGFTKTGHADRWSKLDVKTANLDGYVGVEEKLAEQGILIKTLADTGQDEAFLRKLHKVNDEAIRDIPMSETFTESPYEMFLEELKDPNLSPERVWMALDGEEPAGILIFPLQGRTNAFNGFTGTARAYRGKGIARALKFKSIEWSRENGIDFIYTANDVNNKRMLAINNSLGYQELPIGEEVSLELSSEPAVSN